MLCSYIHPFYHTEWPYSTNNC